MSNTHTILPQPITPSFSGHQTFPFRYTWLKKGVEAVAKDSAIFSQEDASVTLGVGKNMVASIRHWCKVAGLIQTENKQLEMDVGEKRTSYQRGRFEVTDLGKTIFGNKKDEAGLDPYLDDPATLWLIHWQIATNTDLAATWYWTFNYSRGRRFTPDESFRKELRQWAEQQKSSMRSVSENTLKRDIQCFIRTYCPSRYNAKAAITEDTFDCPLVELNLITELSIDAYQSGRDKKEILPIYEFQIGPKETLPAAVVAYALLDFWKPGVSESTIAFSALISNPRSPGRVFRLDENTMATYLEDLKQLTRDALTLDETAGLKQVSCHKGIDPKELLKQHYQKK